METDPPGLLNHIWNCNQYHLTRRKFRTPYPTVVKEENHNGKRVLNDNGYISSFYYQFKDVLIQLKQYLSTS